MAAAQQDPQLATPSESISTCWSRIPLWTDQNTDNTCIVSSLIQCFKWHTYSVITGTWQQGSLFRVYRNKKASYQGAAEAVKSWTCWLLTVLTSILNLRISSVNPLALKVTVRTSTLRRLSKCQILGRWFRAYKANRWDRLASSVIKQSPGLWSESQLTDRKHRPLDCTWNNTWSWAGALWPNLELHVYRGHKFYRQTYVCRFSAGTSCLQKFQGARKRCGGNSGHLDP